MEGFDYTKVKDPRFFAEGRLRAHSDHDWRGENGSPEDGGFRYSLNGLWKFHYAKNYGSTLKGFEKDTFSCDGWDEIRVPAHIQLEGYDAPQYANVQYPWDGHERISPGEIPERFNPAASYVKYFEVPDYMKGRRLFISFQGVESGMALWLNGEYAGYSEDSFTPAEFELTPYVREGRNKLAVQVFKWTSGSWCEDQDFFRFSGIYRDVFLFTIPDTHIYDMCVRTILDDNYQDAVLQADLALTGGGRVSLEVLENGQTVAKQVMEARSQAGADDFSAVLDERFQDRGAYARFELPVEKPRLWSAEQPFLYELRLEVFDEAGVRQETVEEQAGFRRFEIRDSIMCLNGKRIVFNGVNRHEFSSLTGRHVSDGELLTDLVTMKRNNINAIRTCHYPDDSRIYRLCDRFGIYMIDETNLESHGSWDAYVRGITDGSQIVPGDKPEWKEMMLDRVESIYRRDRNHPSVLIWSCGNESYGGANLYEMSRKFKRLDPTRPVHYEGIFWDRRYNATSDIESRMYPSAQEIREFLQKDRSKPFICCEYTHAMGNSCGAMHKYTELAETEPLYQGGFIWDYIDQSIKKKDRYGKAFQAYGGDFDDRPTDYNFSGNGIVYGGQRGASPKMQEVKYCYQNIGVTVEDGKAVIRNRNLFVGTDAFDCAVTLEKDGVLIERRELKTDVEPLSEKTYPLYWTLRQEPGEYAVTVSFTLREDTEWAKRGHETAFGQGVYRIEDAGGQRGAVREKPPLTVVHGNYNLGVRGDGFEALFSMLNGGLVSYRYGGKEMLKSIPKPNFWRAPTDNDWGNDMPFRYAQWKTASLYLTHKTTDGAGKGWMNPLVEEGEDGVTLTYVYRMPTVPESACALAYTVRGDGRIRVRLSYDPAEGLGDMPEFGVIFKLDADYDRMEWYGMGPEETYEDRQKGARLGIYKRTVKENMAEYLVPQECGARTGVRWARVTDERGRGLLFEAESMSFSALPYTPHELENAAHAFELPEAHYTVIRAAKQQMGVGGDDSWGARTHPEYLLDAGKRLVFEFSFQGI